MQDIIKALQQIQADMKVLHGKINAKKYGKNIGEEIPGKELASGGMPGRKVVEGSAEEENLEAPDEENKEAPMEGTPEEEAMETPEEENIEDPMHSDEGGLNPDKLKNMRPGMQKKPVVKITAIKTLLRQPPKKFK